MLIILLLGAAFGSSEARIGVAGGAGALGRRLVDTLDSERNLAVARFSSKNALVDAVERGEVSAGVVVPPDYDRTLRSGGTARLRYLARPDSLATQLRSTLDAAVADESAIVRAARFVAERRRTTFERGLKQAQRTAAVVPPIEVRVTGPGGGAYPEAGGQFDEGASTQLILFIFLTSLTSAAALIEARRLGVSRRMLSTPTSVRTILFGEGLGRLGIALVQALIIVVGSALAFGVTWGDPLAAGATILTFCLVGSGAGLLLGSVLENEQQATAISLLLGLGLAAFGGSMVPLEVFPESVRTVAHATPHAWANDAFSELLRHGGNFDDVARELAVLLGYAAALVTVAVWRFRRSLTA
jgi:ABC-2 type transport system permease protein